MAHHIKVNNVIDFDSEIVYTNHKIINMNPMKMEMDDNTQIGVPSSALLLLSLAFCHFFKSLSCSLLLSKCSLIFSFHWSVLFFSALLAVQATEQHKIELKYSR